MATAQLNVRIDDEVKRAGDAVLERLGVPAVQVIRATWQYMADNQRLPDFVAAGGATMEADADRVAYINSGGGMAVRMAKEAGIRAEFDSMSFDEIRETAYEEMLAEQEERRV